MTPTSRDLFRVAERLDQWPMELLNGGAVDALTVLNGSATEAEELAKTRGIDVAAVNALWERANASLRDVPEPDRIYAAAAEAAALLYIAAWVIESESATTDELNALL